ncbi:bifunctional DNA-formamidopyrimidine glycosylase/DNA-(apurinic or apyrimidinic site) lyase [Pelistega suis]|uniref:Formamidopyrimidine-DNA glycosylase n=1 Tax=Pelistega suis TaxID=1631957 RepID=A0A849P6G1_9BURK|nr:bifunctional DNA-formamidopyrimidine glycosylase/DNA-(apurinic or apyrimidinic site) lyase [Pelistega suis]NOL51335.1 bifunctional DNA-formamidopyrimidine glycosylase/DNA-(apurinic or apyrimidinic site) lyase [Pelistega suis]
MPELPEVETTLRGIEPYITHQLVDALVVRQAQLRWCIQDNLNDILRGQRIIGCHRRAKYLLIQFEIGTLIIHLGMSGSLRIFRDNIPAPLKHDHVDIRFKNGVVLRYHDPRRFGAILWFEEKHDAIPLLTHLGPEPLEDNFNGNYLYQTLKTQSRPIKTALMDNEVVVGVGNIYANESLFAAGILPTRAAKSLKKKECITLVEAIQKILRRAIETGGSTLKDFVDSEGRSGYFQQEYKVYGRADEACKACDTPIQKSIIGQRGTFFCPRCQR